MLPHVFFLVKHGGGKQVECTQILSLSWDCLANHFHLLAGTWDNGTRGAGLHTL